MEYKYDKESDVLSVSLRNKPFAYAREVGDIIVHFDEKDTPVYLEFLNAHLFLKKAADTLPKSLRNSILQHLQ